MRIERQRIAWLDSLRGVGIALVVVGHCLSSSGLKTWIYSFHVPLLFILSGFLNQLLHGGERRFRPKRLILPYMIWSILSVFYLAVRLNFERTIPWMVNDIIPIVGFSSWNVALWFLYVMILIDVFKPLWNDWKTYIPLGGFLTVSIGVRLLIPSAYNAFGWKNVLFGTICYGIGEMICRLSIVEHVCYSKILSPVIFAAGSIVGCYNGFVSTYACCYGHSVVLLFISSILISVSLMALFKQFELMSPSWLALLGRCSLFIMVSHCFILTCCRKMLMRDISLNNALIQVLEGVMALGLYLVYFKISSCLKISHLLPDYFGGYKFSKES